VSRLLGLSFFLGLMTLGGCELGPTGPGRDWSDAIGTPWKLTQLDGRTPLAERVPTITLAADGRVAGSSGANRFFGTYETDPSGAIRFGALGSTRMYLDDPPGLMRQEGRLLEVLSEVDGYRLDQDRLRMFSGSDRRLVWTRPTSASESP
jgi:heat shock protein HslJ